ncbi:unnamed protein product [Caenorhabditis auriculariae]|uniref:Potassium channel domain-containing protein n=1 Tax=Caenorhabditis auriculariae TaxID=2777116 RepID=A0A8S1H3J9_9PELO|nr:unnamed protein product [Caenorhabditis auriculariae]
MGEHKARVTELILNNSSAKIVKKKETSIAMKLCRPYYVWREEFREDRCCRKGDVQREFWTAAIPHVLLNIVLILYILIGSIVFSLVDDNLYKLTWAQRILFSFTTISTIGYGDIVPISFWGKAVCIGYSFFGIPLLFLIVSNDGKIIVFLYNVVLKSIWPEAKSVKVLPASVSIALLTIHCLIGGLIFQWIDKMPFFEGVYFSFITISTIGYGDLHPTPDTVWHLIVIFVYVLIGIVILSTLIARASIWLTWMHNIGRDFSDSSKVEVWFHGQKLTVEDLVVMVAEQFQCPPERLRDVLRHLDKILEMACDEQNEEEEDTSQSDLSSPTTKKGVMYLELADKNMVRLYRPSSGDLTEEENQKTITSESFLNLQKTIPKETETAIQALGTITHHLRKASERRQAPSLPRTPPALKNLMNRNTSENLLEHSPSVRKTAFPLPPLLDKKRQTSNFIYPGGMKGLVDLGGTRTYDLADVRNELCQLSYAAPLRVLYHNWPIDIRITTVLKERKAAFLRRWAGPDGQA